MRWLVVSALVACQPVNSPLMQPGNDCLSCHQVGAEAQSKVWTVAGTVFADPAADENAGVEHAQILVTDSNGKTLTLETNSVGNFYTAEALVFPVQVEVQKGTARLGMDSHPAGGACNSCHNQPPSNEALGRIFIQEPQ